MGYNNYNNQGQGNYNNNQRNNYQQNNGGYQQRNNGYNQSPPPVEISPEEFINERVAIYNLFSEQIKAQGQDPSDFAFALGGWVTSYFMARKNGR